MIPFENGIPFRREPLRLAKAPNVRKKNYQPAAT